MTRDPGKKPNSSVPLWLSGSAAVGLLWMLLSGVCTGVVAVPLLFSDYSGPAMGMLGLMVGGVSIAIGAVIWLFSWRSNKWNNRR